MFEVPSTFRPPSMFGPPSMFTGIPAASTGVESAWCLSFDGVNDWVDISGSLDSLLDGAITLSCWAKLPTHVGVLDIILHFGSSSSRCVAMTAYTGGVSATVAALGAIHRTSGNGNWAYGSAPSSVNIGDNNWHHLAIVSAGPNNAASILLYVDGVSVTSAGNGSINTAGANRIGGVAGYNFAGQVDDVRIYNRALSPTEVTAIYTNTSPPTDVTAYLDLEEGTGTTTAVKDSTGSTIATATLTNGPTWSNQVPPALAP